MIINIPLSKAYELLEEASAIIVSSESGSPLLYPSLHDDDEAFLFISWEDENGGYELMFTKQNNLNPQINTLTNELILTDDTGEKVNLTLLTTMKL